MFHDRQITNRDQWFGQNPGIGIQSCAFSTGIDHHRKVQIGVVSLFLTDIDICDLVIIIDNGNGYIIFTVIQFFSLIDRVRISWMNICSLAAFRIQLSAFEQKSADISIGQRAD